MEEATFRQREKSTCHWKNYTPRRNSLTREDCHGEQTMANQSIFANAQSGILIASSLRALAYADAAY
jgi:hypothetical protein